VIDLEKESKKEWPKEKQPSMAEKTPDGKYKCKVCGQIFPTAEAHDEHHRKMHEQTGKQMPAEKKPVKPKTK